VFVLVCALAALAANQWLNDLAPGGSLARAAIEWTLFCVILSISFTASILVLLP